MNFEDLELRTRAFEESRILLTAIELNVFTALEGGATSAEAARRLGTSPGATERLLNALVALEFLSKTRDKFENGEVASRWLVEGSPESARPAMLHTVHRWHSWSTLTGRVRGAPPAEKYDEMNQDDYDALLAMQDRRAQNRAPALVAAIGTEGVHRILDLGGGSAAYSIAFARVGSQLEADVLDLPEVLPITRRYIAASGLAERVHARPGDLLTADLGSGYDLILLFSLAHLLGEDDNRRLLARCRRALTPGGRVAIHDHIMDAGKTAPRAGAVFALRMLVATSGGGTYSYDEYARWLQEAGFSEIEHRKLGGPTGLVIGRAPAVRPAGAAD